VHFVVFGHDGLFSSVFFIVNLNFGSKIQFQKRRRLIRSLTPNIITLQYITPNYHLRWGKQLILNPCR
jgi:hypothetical protein